MLIYLSISCLIWILFFGIFRAVFFLYNYHAGASVWIRTLASSIFHALPLDLALACEISLPLGLILLPFELGKPKSEKTIRVWRHMLVSYLTLAAVAYGLVASTETAMYSEWRVKLNPMILSYIKMPSQVFTVVRIGEILEWIALNLSLAMLFGMISSKTVRWYLEHESRKRKTRLRRLILAALALLGISAGARGGIHALPIDSSRVYFSTDSIVNDATANPGWAFGKALITVHTDFLYKQRYAVFTSEEANETVAHLHESSNVPSAKTRILNTSKPNVVFIVLESWSYRMIADVEPLRGLTPFFQELTQEGLLFTNFFANGNRSQQGIASIYSGFPALPEVTVTDLPSKTRKLPKLIEAFNQSGYASSFIYGGQLEFGNIKALLIENDVQTIRDRWSFDGNYPAGYMGIQDGAMFAEFLKILNDERQPFVSSLYTLSSHAPYDIPDPESYSYDGPFGPYIKSIMYSDRMLGKFFEQAKKQPWYEHTLFVLVSDHSHVTPGSVDVWQAEYRRIPLLLVGGALKSEFRGQKNEIIGSQVDLAATLINQIELLPKEMVRKNYPWSKDLFDPSAAHFAYYELNQGVGWVSPQVSFAYNRELDHLYFLSGRAEDFPETKKQAFSYLQTLYQTFVSM